jgi:hypothetical protein
MLSAVDRKWILLSANLATLLLSLAQMLVLLLIVVLVTGVWSALPWGLYLAVCLHLATAPAYNFTSIVGPYRQSGQFFGKNEGNLWVMLAWFVATPPVLLLCFLPFLVHGVAAWLLVPLPAIYSFGIYWLTLAPSARFLDRRTHRVLEVVAGPGD